MPLGVTPLSAAASTCFYGVLVAVAVWMKSRRLWFGLLFFVIALLPVSFIPARLGFVLYLPLAGLALYGAVCLVRFKESLCRLFSRGIERRAIVRLRVVDGRLGGVLPRCRSGNFSD